MRAKKSKYIIEQASFLSITENSTAAPSPLHVTAYSAVDLYPGWRARICFGEAMHRYFQDMYRGGVLNSFDKAIPAWASWYGRFARGEDESEEE